MATIKSCSTILQDTCINESVFAATHQFQLFDPWKFGFAFCTVCRFQDEEISRSHIVAATGKWVGIDPKMQLGGRDQVGFSRQIVSSVSENTISVPWTETHNNNTGTTHFLMIDKKHLWLFALFVQLFSSYLKFTDLYALCPCPWKWFCQYQRTPSFSLCLCLFNRGSNSRLNILNCRPSFCSLGQSLQC